MEPCDQPLGAMSFCEASSCVWRKGELAVSSVIDAPASASITDWAFAVLAALFLLNLLILLFKALTPRSNVQAPTA